MTERNCRVMFLVSRRSKHRRLALRSYVIFSAMLEGNQIGCYGKQWLPRGITKGQLLFLPLKEIQAKLKASLVGFVKKNLVARHVSSNITIII